MHVSFNYIFLIKNYCVYHTPPPPYGAGLDSRLLHVGHKVFVRRAQELS